MKRSVLRALAATAVLAVMLLTGCKQGMQVTDIKTLLDDPSRFDKTTVRVMGDVTKSVGIMGYGAYQVTDPTGSIMIVTKENGAPRQGAHVGVEGEFRSAFTLGTETVAVIVESGRYTPPSK
jgi:hypothetical protein